MHDCHTASRRLAATVNAPVLHALAARAGHTDPDCINIFKNGAELYLGDVQPLWEQCYESNCQLLHGLREDVNAAELHALTQKDAALGRMSPPVPVGEVDLTSVSFLRLVFSHLFCFLGWLFAGKASTEIRSGTGPQARRRQEN